MSNLVKSKGLEVMPNGVVSGKIEGVSANSLYLYNKNKSEQSIGSFQKADKEKLQQLDQIIATWAYGLGIDIKANDIYLLSEFIKENFGFLNLFDLKLVVKFITTDSGELNVDANHYGKLSFIYVSKVLKAYQEYRSSTIFDVSRAISKATEVPPAPPTKEERLDIFKVLLKNAKEDRASGWDYYDLNDSIWAFLVKNKLVDLNPKTNGKQIEDAQEYGHRQFEKSEFEKTLKPKAFHTELSQDEYIRKQSRRYMVNLWLDKVDMKKFLDNIKPEMLT